jgi:surfactin synthase thioesterase subunit
MPDEQSLRLYCFAHAGAGVSVFYGWAHTTGPHLEPVPVLLPGREARRGEARVTTRTELLADVLPLFTDPPKGPYLLYGHSLGALVAYTVTRALHEAGLPGPALLALGACPPPDTGSDLSDACHAPDDELFALLGELDALPPGAARGGFWHRAVMPVLRDDLILAQALRAAARGPLAGPPLTVPLLTVAGTRDPLAPPGVTANWRHFTDGPSWHRTVEGDHFFVRGRELPALLDRAGRVVRRLAPAAPPVPA